MEVLVIRPGPEGRRLVDAAEEVAEAGRVGAVVVLLHLGDGGGVQELVDVDAGAGAGDHGRGVEGDHAAAVLMGVLLGSIHGSSFGGRRRARDVEVDLGAVLAAVAAGRLRLLVQVDQL